MKYLQKKGRPCVAATRTGEFVGDASKLAEIAAELERVKVEKDEQKAALEAEAEAQKAEQAKQVEEVQAAMSKAAEAEKAELKREFEREASVALCTRTLGRIMKKSESRAFRAWSQFVLDAKVAEGRCVDKMSERFEDRKRARMTVPPRVFCSAKQVEEAQAAIAKAEAEKEALFRWC